MLDPAAQEWVRVGILFYYHCFDDIYSFMVLNLFCMMLSNFVSLLEAVLLNK